MVTAARDYGKARRMHLRPTSKGEVLTCRLEFVAHPPIEFEMTSHGAMVLMQALRHYQRKHHWPIPMVRFSTSPGG